MPETARLVCVGVASAETLHLPQANFHFLSVLPAEDLLLLKKVLLSCLPSIVHVAHSAIAIKSSEAAVPDGGGGGGLIGRRVCL